MDDGLEVYASCDCDSGVAVARRTDARFGRLSERELDITELMGMSFSTKTIANLLEISAGTVKWHTRNIFSKLNAGTREEVLRKARSRGLINPVLPGAGRYEVSERRRRRLEVLGERVRGLSR